mgnify:CR=1 FL=1
MLLKRLITCGVLLVSLSGCQSIKMGDMFSSNEYAVPVEKQSTPQSEQSQQLLSAISVQAEQTFTQDDEALAQKALESNFTHQGASWLVAEGEITVMPTRTFEKVKGQFCREYQAKMTKKTSELSVNSIACRQDSGLWIKQK